MPELHRTLANRIAALRGWQHAPPSAARTDVSAMAFPSFHAFAPDTPDADEPPPAPQPPRLDNDPPLRRLLGGKLGRGDKEVTGSMSERLRSLRHTVPEQGEPEGPPDPDPVQQQPRMEAEIMFTAGPRAGERLHVRDGLVALDRDAQVAADSGGSNVVASIWPQGARFMLRHNGGILISGARPALSVVTLDDGDELAWGAHRMRFSLAEAAGRP